MSDELDARIAAAVLADERARKVDAVRRLIDEETADLRAEVESLKSDREMGRVNLAHYSALIDAYVGEGEQWRVRALTAEQDAATLMDTLTKRSAVVNTLGAENQRLRAALANVREVHVRCADHCTCSDSDDFCHECGQMSPCLTIRTLDGTEVSE